MLNEAIERIARKYTRSTMVAADEIVDVQMVNEEGLRAALSELAEFVVKQAAEVATRIQCASECGTPEAIACSWSQWWRELRNGIFAHPKPIPAPPMSTQDK